MTGASRTTGAVTALLVLIGLGLFGQLGWVAALVLAAIAGGLMAAFLHWLIDLGPAAMDATEWHPPTDAAPVAAAAPASAIAVAAEAMPQPAPREVPQPDRSIYADAGPDDLRAIKGIGEKVEAALGQAGVTRYAQIAAWDDTQIDAMAGRIGRLAVRIRNDDWVGQARALAEARQGGS